MATDGVFAMGQVGGLCFAELELSDEEYEKGGAINVIDNLGGDGTQCIKATGCR